MSAPTAEMLRLANKCDKVATTYKHQRDRYPEGSRLYEFHDGRYFALRDLAKDLREDPDEFELHTWGEVRPEGRR